MKESFMQGDLVMGNKILDACVLAKLQQYPDCGKIRYNHVNIQTYIKKVPQFERLGLNINAELKYIHSQNLVWLCRPQSLITGKTKHAHLNFLRKSNDHLEGQISIAEITEVFWISTNHAVLEVGGELLGSLV